MFEELIILTMKNKKENTVFFLEFCNSNSVNRSLISVITAELC